MDGHTMTVGGCIVDKRKLRLECPCGLTTPDESYHESCCIPSASVRKAYITKATRSLCVIWVQSVPDETPSF